MFNQTLLVLNLFVAGLTASFGQQALPPLPDEDYAVYSIIINAFSYCDGEQYKHRQGGLLLLDTKTVALSEFSSSEIDFKQLDQYFFTNGGPQMFGQPDWKNFVESINSSSFAKYQIEKPLPLQCRKTIGWTSELSDQYFGKNAAKKGYYDLRKDYKNFDGIIRFSKVAYSADKRKAICCFSESHDYENAAGYLIFLEQEGLTWKITGSIMLWIS